MVDDIIKLRLCDIEDAKFLLDLRMKNGEFLSETVDDIELQKEWLKNYKERESKKEEFYFVIEEGVDRVGSVRVYEIDYKIGSFTFGSFIIDKILAGNKYASVIAMIKVLDFAFDELKLQKCYFDCKVINVRANNFYQKFGAQKINQDIINVFYKYDRRDHIKNKKEILKAINYD